MYLNGKTKPKMCSESSNAKKSKTTDRAYAADTFVTSSGHKQSPDIFKLDIDCCEETIDYISLIDLISVSKTCKRLYQVAGWCFRLTYPNVTVSINREGLNVLENVQVTHFAEFIRKIKIDGHDYCLSNFLKIQSKLRRLKEVEMSGRKLFKDDNDRMKETLGKLEVLRLTDCTLSENLRFNNVMDHCANIKILQINGCAVDFDWLTQKYPTLNNLKFHLPLEHENQFIDGLTTFLAINPNIQKFATSGDILWTNRDSLKNATVIKLNELAIELQLNSTIEFNTLCCLLNELHARGFYQRLELIIRMRLASDAIDQLVTLNGLVKLDVSDNRFAFSALTNLEEIRMRSSASVTDPESAVKNLVNLKRIHFHVAFYRELMLFITQSAPLRELKTTWLGYGPHFSHHTHVMDLVALNQERQKLDDARKLTMYLHEDVYLFTKWTLKETNFEFIRLKRTESRKCDADF